MQTDATEELLNDPGDLAAGEFTPEPEPDLAPAREIDPIHLAKCSECASAVKYQPTTSGTSFTVVEGEGTYGIGENGRPLCPNGHGEMAIADDQLKPVPEAFADAQAMLLAAEGGPTQASLPGVFPPFNFEGAFKEIVDQARNVERLKADYDDAKEEAASAKKALDKAAELLMSMTLEFERRRRDKTAEPPSAPPVEPSPRLVKCTWEAAHPNDPCPLCGEKRDEFLIAQLIPNPSALPPSDAEAHVEAVDRYLVSREVYETQQSLEAIDTYVSDEIVQGWTSDERKAVTLYADQQDDLKNNIAQSDDAPRLERPKVLGRPHVPEDPHTLDEGPQRCSICNKVLPKAEGSYLYAVTDLVGVDCIGKAAAEGHHYPEKKKAGKKSGKARR